MKRIQRVDKEQNTAPNINYLLKKSVKKSEKKNAGKKRSGKKTSPDIKIVDLPPNTSHDTIQFIQQFEKQNKELKSQVQKYESGFNELLEFSSDAIIILNKNFTILQFNKNFKRLSGYSKNEIEKAVFPQIFFSKSDKKKLLKSIERLGESKSTKKPKNVELEFLRKDQSRVPVEIRFSRNNELGGLLVFLRDISKIKQYEREIFQRKKELSLLAAISKSIQHPKNLNKNLKLSLESSSQLIGIEQGAICLGDSRFKNLQVIVTTGMAHSDAEKLLERHFDLVVRLKKEKKAICINPSSGLFVEFFTRHPKCRSMALIPLFVRKNIFGVLVLASLKHIEFDQERKQLLSVIGHQLSINIENSILFKELEEKTREVETKNKELSSFVCTVSHDLKTPIIALHGFLGLLEERYGDKIEGEGNEYLDRVFRNAEYMEKMINDLLKLSRAGRVVGVKRRFSTYKLVNEILMCLYPQIQEKNINCVVSNTLPIIYGDRDRLLTVFENLIVNAIKYTSDERPSQIEISCKEKKKVFQFSVKDNGIGIEKENHEHIFEVFQKCKQNSDTSEGTGVGLTIVKKIINHHEGNVWVESKLNRGATFHFTLPKNLTKQKKIT